MRAITRFGWAAAAVLCGLAARGAANPPSEGWVATGSFGTGRRAIQHSVRLADGRILVAGGYAGGDGSSLDTAEVYDPAAGTWSAAGTMAVKRAYATLDRLPDGRVLVAGGTSLAPVFASTEIWDPATSTFSAGPSMSMPRSSHVSVGLADGRILVAGGFSSSSSPYATDTAEIYDPAANSWTATGSMLHHRAGLRAVLLHDGRVLLAGGQEGAPDGYRGRVECQIFDPATGTFAAAASMAAPRDYHAMTLLADGRALVVGGGRNATGSNIHTAEIYDPSTGSWTSAGTTGSGGTGPTLTLLADGRALAAGGMSVADDPCRLADLFDPATGVFAPAPEMTEVHAIHSADLLPDGSVLVAGGYLSFSTAPYYSDACELFVPAPASNHAPTADAGADRVVECAGSAGTGVALDGGGSADEDGDGLSWSWTWDGGSASGAAPTVSLGEGTHVITLTVDDGRGGTAVDQVVVTVADTTAPSVSGLSADPAVIDAVNHKMVAVAVRGTATDLCDPHPTLRILAVSSNEPENGLGDGDTDGDWVITGDLTLELRAERSGKGTGRVYTITLLAADAAGNEATATVTVTVPRDSGGGGGKGGK